MPLSTITNELIWRCEIDFSKVFSYFTVILFFVKEVIDERAARMAPSMLVVQWVMVSKVGQS